MSDCAQSKNLAQHGASRGGYVGILLILIGTAITVMLFMRTYFTATPSPQSAQPTTQFDRLQNDIDATKAVSNQMDQKASETNRVLNSLK